MSIYLPHIIFHPVSHITIHPVCIAVLTHSDNTNRLYCKALRNLSQADNTNRLYCWRLGGSSYHICGLSNRQGSKTDCTLPPLSHIMRTLSLSVGCVYTLSDRVRKQTAGTLPPLSHIMRTLSLSVGCVYTMSDRVRKQTAGTLPPLSHIMRTLSLSVGCVYTLSDRVRKQTAGTLPPLSHIMRTLSLSVGCVYKYNVRQGSKANCWHFTTTTIHHERTFLASQWDVFISACSDDKSKYRLIDRCATIVALLITRGIIDDER